MADQPYVVASRKEPLSPDSFECDECDGSGRYFINGKPRTCVCAEDGMDIGHAIHAMKNGKRVCREGWNGKGMWLVLIRAGNAMHTSPAGGFNMQDCIGMKTATGDMQPGWLASQADLLASDWQVLDG